MQVDRPLTPYLGRRHPVHTLTDLDQLRHIMIPLHFNLDIIAEVFNQTIDGVVQRCSDAHYRNEHHPTQCQCNQRKTDALFATE